jgi:hypothetical protein
MGNDYRQKVLKCHILGVEETKESYPKSLHPSSENREQVK